MVTFGRPAQLALQHLVGAQHRVELDERDVRDDAREVDGRLDTRVAAADDRDALALEQRTVAVRAVGDALFRYSVSPGTFIERQRAPVDRITVRARSEAPLSSSTSTRPFSVAAGTSFAARWVFMRSTSYWRTWFSSAAPNFGPSV